MRFSVIDEDHMTPAQRAVYDAESRGLSAERLKQHFLRGTGTNSGLIRVKPDLARMVDFRTFNLMSPQWSLGDAFDVIFCRNVMIYFDNPTKERLVSRFADKLVPNGHLYIGHSERVTGPALDTLSNMGPTIYARRAA